MDQVLREMRGHALTYLVEQPDSMVGEWLWNLAERIEEECRGPGAAVIWFPVQRDSSALPAGYQTPYPSTY